MYVSLLIKKIAFSILYFDIKFLFYYTIYQSINKFCINDKSNKNKMKVISVYILSTKYKINKMYKCIYLSKFTLKNLTFHCILTFFNNMFNIVKIYCYFFNFR